MTDDPLRNAAEIIEKSIEKDAIPSVKSFFDEATFTASHVVYDPASGRTGGERPEDNGIHPS